MEDRLSISRPRCAIGFKNTPVEDGHENLRRQLVMGIVWRLIAARSSPYFERLYNEGLIDDSFGASFAGTPQYSYSLVTSETDDPRRLVEEIKQIVQEVQKGPISEADVERIKRQLYGGFIAAFDSLEYVANSYIIHHFNQTPYLKYLNVLQSLTVDDVRQAANDYLDLGKVSVSILWPHGEDNESDQG